MPENRNRLWADDTVERYDKMMEKKEQYQL